MHETVWLGRGGQGAFTAARLLGVAAMLCGKQAMALPAFGPERRGAPVFAYTRIDDNRIHDRSAVQRADAAVVLDPSLLTQVATGFLTPDTVLIIDSDDEEIAEPGAGISRLVRIPARRIARETMGTEHTNTVLFGALAGLTQIVPQSTAEESIRREFGKNVGTSSVTSSKAMKNIDAFRAAYVLAARYAGQGIAHA